MKWYMALNEAGTHSDIGLHAKLAVLSGRRHTSLVPKMLYIGARNDFTRWLERHDVEVIDQELPYIDVIDRLVAENRYSRATLGHWLRTNVCLAETEDTHVLYTDVDVMFRNTPDIRALKPEIFAVAPEFDRNSWNYFNAGVMVANVEGLRRDYAAFEAYLRESIYKNTYGFHDQIAYNSFYKGRWDRLPVTLNWKPYWGIEPAADLIHFHGPKIGAMHAIASGKWNWKSDHGMQIGSMFVGFLDKYKYYMRLILAEADGLSDQEIERLQKIEQMVAAFSPDPAQPTSLSFMNYKMLPNADNASPRSG